MTDTTTAPAKPALRPNVRAIAGYLLILAGLAALWRDATVLSGLTILGVELAGAGTVLVATVLRRQALRRRTV